jgi:hypothetical protein
MGLIIHWYPHVRWHHRISMVMSGQPRKYKAVWRCEGTGTGVGSMEDEVGRGWWEGRPAGDGEGGNLAGDV